MFGIASDVIQPTASVRDQGDCDHWQRCPEEYMNRGLFQRLTPTQESNPGANLGSNAQIKTEVK